MQVMILLLLVTTVSSQAGALEAQAASVTLRGAVFDSTRSFPQPIGGVTVSVDSLNIAGQTNAAGEFRLTGVPPGAHTLSVRKNGFAPLDFRLVVPESSVGELWGPTIALLAGPTPTATLSGVVTDGDTGQPVVGVTVALNGSVIIATDRNGAFRFADLKVEWGKNLMEVRRIGYSVLTDELWVTGYDMAWDLDITLEPVTVGLEPIEVVAEGDVNEFGRLSDFYRRRKGPFGDFMTRQEIEERKALHVTDFLRTVPGMVIGRNGVWMRRSGGRCPPAVYIDGALLGDADIDFRLAPEHVAGIEVYKGPAEVPQEFSRAGLACGVIVIWTLVN